MTAYRRMPSQLHLAMSEVNDDQQQVEQLSLVSPICKRDDLVADSSRFEAGPEHLGGLRAGGGRFCCTCAQLAVRPEQAKRDHVAAYVQELSQRPLARAKEHQAPIGLANATLQQRLTAVRLFFDHLVEPGIRRDNPVGRGRYVAGSSNLHTLR
jgi:hypothetical protein